MKHNNKHSRGNLTVASSTKNNLTGARHRIGAALQNGKAIYGRVKTTAVNGAKATDKAVREHPYQAIGVAAGIGLLIGWMVARRRTTKANAATAE